MKWYILGKHSSVVLSNGANTKADNGNDSLINLEDSDENLVNLMETNDETVSVTQEDDELLRKELSDSRVEPYDNGDENSDEAFSKIDDDEQLLIDYFSATSSSSGMNL